MRKITPLILIIVLVAAACSSSGGTFSATSETPDAGGGDDEPIDSGSGGTGSGGTAGIGAVTASAFTFAASLEPFDECEAFLSHIRGEAAERVGPYGLEGYGGFIGGPVPLAEGGFEGDVVFEEEAPASELDTAAEPAFDDAGGVAGSDFSETNVQVEGVDEPDIVKTDGERIVTVLNNTLQVVDVRGGDANAAGRVFLDSGWNQEMILAGDRALVIGAGDGYVLAEQLAGEATIAPDYLPYYETTVVQLVDLSDNEPRVLSTLQLEGRYVAAREVDGLTRIVVTSPPAQLQFVYPQGPGAEDVAAEANRRIVQESTLEDWLTSYSLTDADGATSTGQLVECDRIHRPAEFAGFDQLAVLTIDVDADLRPVDATSVIASGETVYANATSLYVGTTVYAQPEWFEEDDLREFEEKFSTSLHRFDIAGEKADYVASGSVRGHMLSQFSMDELDGRLRVATTDGTPWGFADSSESYVTVFETEGDELVQVGQVGNLGRGERIFAVRFAGELAYVVTFRQVDPFYVVDLSAPDDPSVVGELKIPGFSSYLHPIGDGMILGVGQDADPDGFTRGSKVSLFDVNDPTDPREIAVWTVPGSSSDVEWDHRAFLWWDRDALAVLPVNVWQENFAGAIVLEVADGEITEVGRIDHSSSDVSFGVTDCRRVDPGELGQWGEDLRFELEEGGALAIVCGPNDEPAVSGYYCDEPIPAGEAASFYGYRDFALEAADSDTFSLCWREYYGGADPILRTLVVDDQLWSLSWRFLQANSLDDLTRTEQFPLG